MLAFSFFLCYNKLNNNIEVIELIKYTDLTKDAYRISDLATFFGVTTVTLRTWEKEGRIEFLRTEGKSRYLTKYLLIEELDKRGLFFDDRPQNKKDVLYARVSSHDQKQKGDLDRQIMFLLTNVSDLQHPVVLSEVGSGLNDKRKKFQKLIKMIMNDEVSRIFVTYKNRLTRFGFNMLDEICKIKDVQIIVVNQDVEKQSVEEELVSDMMSLIASFSGKLYGLRSKQKKHKIELSDLEELGYKVPETKIDLNIIMEE